MAQVECRDSGGGELMLGYENMDLSYEYGNAITIDNQNPSTSNFGRNTSASVLDGYRLLNQSVDGVLQLGLGGFVGVEYFIAPQISIGGEFSVSVYNKSPLDKRGIVSTTEGLADKSVVEYQYRSLSVGNKDSYFGFSAIPQGNLFLMFYF